MVHRAAKAQIWFTSLMKMVWVPSSIPQEELLLLTNRKNMLLSEKSQRSADGTAEKIYEWIRASATSKLTAEKTAGHFGFSPDHVTRIIKKNYGIGVKALINNFVLSKAKELLANTEKYVKEIAYELEFDNDKAFIGFFKYHEGVFPSEFRDRFYKIHMNRK